ncbi:hypothetical protein OH77DRAFT_1438865 [Trametes cingulata]|nr:hypothetical protein OH77DRAFT_1438865 [Trametes cingulata]
MEEYDHDIEGPVVEARTARKDLVVVRVRNDRPSQIKHAFLRLKTTRRPEEVVGPDPDELRRCLEELLEYQESLMDTEEDPEEPFGTPPNRRATGHVVPSQPIAAHGPDSRVGEHLDSRCPAPRIDRTTADSPPTPPNPRHDFPRRLIREGRTPRGRRGRSNCYTPSPLSQVVAIAETTNATPRW